MTARLSRPGRPKAPEICEGAACKAERRPASAAPSVRLAARKGVWQQGGFARTWRNDFFRVTPSGRWKGASDPILPFGDSPKRPYVSAIRFNVICFIALWSRGVALMNERVLHRSLANAAGFARHLHRSAPALQAECRLHGFRIRTARRASPECPNS